MTFLPFLLFGLLIVAVLINRHFSLRRKREQLLAAPLTSEQRKVVAELVPIVRRLPASLLPKLEGKINLFLDQVTFHGNQGLEVTDQMRLSIAAQACLLIVNSPVWYDTLRTILIYPSAFRTYRDTHGGFCRA
jgi:Mlc titration factor MtfA (ptsG expression regulator)